jgi:hypothetical protein
MGIFVRKTREHVHGKMYKKYLYKGKSRKKGEEKFW